MVKLAHQPHCAPLACLNCPLSFGMGSEETEEKEHYSVIEIWPILDAVASTALTPFFEIIHYRF